MRVAALVLGIIGGVIGILAASTATGLGAIGTIAKDPKAVAQATELAGRGGLAIAISIAAMVGGGLAMAKPRFAAALLLFTGLAGVLLVGGFYLLAGPLILVAALLAFLGRHPAPPVAAVST